MEKDGDIGALHNMFYVTMGNGGDLNIMQRFGKEIALELKALGINGVISPAT
jgi:glycine reductase complex component B subunit gamma